MATCPYGASVAAGVDPTKWIPIDKSLYNTISVVAPWWIATIGQLWIPTEMQVSDICALNPDDPALPSALTIAGAIIGYGPSLNAVNEYIKAKLTYLAFASNCVCNGSGSTTAYDLAVTADTPWTYHKLEELSGPTFVDSAGHQNMTANSITSYGTSGPVSGVLAVQGNPAAFWANSGAGPATTWSPTDGNAVEVWIDATSLPSSPGCMIYGYEEDHANGAFLVLNNSGKIEYWWGNAPSWNQWVDTSSLFTTGAWHHVVGTLDGCIAKIYIDGALASQSGTTQCSPTTFTNAANEWLGSFVGATTHPVLTGKLARCAWYAHSLSATRVGVHYAQMLGIVITDPPALVQPTQPTDLVLPTAPTCASYQDICDVLQQIIYKLDFLQRTQPYVVSTTSVAEGTAHAGLSGIGTISVSAPIGIRVQLTTLPSWVGEESASPTYLFDVGFITYHTSEGWIGGDRPASSDTRFTVPAGTYEIGYTFRNGIVATITELTRGP